MVSNPTEILVVHILLISSDDLLFSYDVIFFELVFAKALVELKNESLSENSC